MTHYNRTLQFESAWKYICKILQPIGQMPDKACLDHKQILELQSKLNESGNTIRDNAQASILKKELVHTRLKNLVN